MLEAFLDHLQTAAVAVTAALFVASTLASATAGLVCVSDKSAERRRRARATLNSRMRKVIQRNREWL